MKNRFRFAIHDQLRPLLSTKVYTALTDTVSIDYRIRAITHAVRHPVREDYYFDAFNENLLRPTLHEMVFADELN